jgi:putative FmdB family regulatory protein
MPLFEYRCNSCQALTEALIRTGDNSAVTCGYCGSADMARLVSRFSVRSAAKPKYSEEFREKTLPFLKSQPGAREYLAEGQGSEEARSFALTERVGEKIDSALEQQVFRQP